MDISCVTRKSIGCCFSHSAHWLPARKKLLYTVANPARGLLNRGKKETKKSGSAPTPPPPPRKKKSRGASTCLGATQVGVTQVVSVRLASVQGLVKCHETSAVVQVKRSAAITFLRTHHPCVRLTAYCTESLQEKSLY